MEAFSKQGPDYNDKRQPHFWVEPAGRGVEGPEGRGVAQDLKISDTHKPSPPHPTLQDPSGSPSPADGSGATHPNTLICRVFLPPGSPGTDCVNTICNNNVFGFPFSPPFFYLSWFVHLVIQGWGLEDGEYHYLRFGSWSSPCLMPHLKV